MIVSDRKLRWYLKTHLACTLLGTNVVIASQTRGVSTIDDYVYEPCSEVFLTPIDDARMTEEASELQIRGMDSNHMHSHVTGQLIEWLVGYFLCFLIFFLDSHFAYGVQFYFILRGNDSRISRRGLAEFVGVAFGRTIFETAFSLVSKKLASLLLTEGGGRGRLFLNQSYTINECLIHDCLTSASRHAKLQRESVFYFQLWKSPNIGSTFTSCFVLSDSET